MLALAMLACPATVLAHGGGLDAYGCHNDNKHGGYHCHQGPFAGKAFTSKTGMLQLLKGQRSNSTPSEPLPAAPATPPGATDCAKIKDPAARLACHDRLSPPK